MQNTMAMKKISEITATKKRTTKSTRGSSRRSSINKQRAKAQNFAVEHWAKLFAFELPKDFGKPKKTKGKHAGGRTPCINEQTVRKLEAAFAYDCTVEEACLIAGIYTPRYYAFVKEYPEFLNTVETLRNIPVMIARRTVVHGLSTNSASAMDYLSKKRRVEFGQKLAIDPIKHEHGLAPETREVVDSIFTLFENKAREQQDVQDSADKK